MSQLIRAEGIVLHSLRHGETSRIVTVFTRDSGKVCIIAKGARSKRSQIGAALETFSRCVFLYYEKATRDIQLLKEVSLLDSHTGLREKLSHLTIASALCELCYLTLKDGDAHPDIYDLLEESLKTLDAAPANPLPILWKFELGLFAALGFALTLERCLQCGKELQPPFLGRVGFRFENGAFVGPECAREKTEANGTLSAETFAALAFVASHPMAAVSRLSLPDNGCRELQSFLGKYLSFHLPVRARLKSLSALEWEEKSS
jgi:DNA repair protein RecO (recombination protein O)